MLRCFTFKPRSAFKNPSRWIASPSSIDGEESVNHPCPNSITNNFNIKPQRCWLTVTVLKFIKDLNPLPALPKLEISRYFILSSLHKLSSIDKAFNSDTLIGLVIVNITFQLIRGSMKQFNWDIDPMLVQFNEYVKYAVIECYESLKPEVELC
ncbi:hypothetical protein L1887_19115 [Cichorium endivia]|nr:hypothetical protein L1887_19115 [Cichorium endivia]